ncbi:MAG: universal stress protein [Aquificae bacterium]|nr:universal stress protein [Aquificota bacterium]
MFKRVLLGLDGSPSSLTCARYAFELAKRVKAPLVGIFVLDESLLDESLLRELSYALGFEYSPGVSEHVREHLEKQADGLLRALAEEGRERSVPVSLVQLYGIPWEEILSEADPADIIFVGKKGKKMKKGKRPGTNTLNLAKNAPCPVFVFPKSEKDPGRVYLIGKDNGDISKLIRETYGWETVEKEEGLEEAFLLDEPVLVLRRG